MSAEYSVVARNLNKIYRVPVNEGRRLEGLLPSKKRSVHAVKGVSFATEKRQAIGILGKMDQESQHCFECWRELRLRLLVKC